MAERLIKEGKWTIRMGEGNTIGIFKPVVPFNCIVDTDVGLIELIKNEYRSPDIFNIGLLDSFKSNRELIKLLYKRTVRNPLLPFMVNPEDTETADDLYIQFMQKEYESVLNYSVMTGLYKLSYYFVISEEIAPVITYSNDLELEFISKDKVLKKIKDIHIREIPIKCSGMDIFFFKDIWDSYFVKSLPILKSKNVTILDYRYNFDSDGAIITNETTTAIEISRCRLNIINAYNAKEIGLNNG